MISEPVDFWKSTIYELTDKMSDTTIVLIEVYDVLLAVDQRMANMANNIGDTIRFPESPLTRPIRRPVHPPTPSPSGEGDHNRQIGPP